MDKKQIEKFTIETIQGKRISILGGGRSGIAAAKLAVHLGCDIFISDNRDTPNIKDQLSAFPSETDGHTEAVLDADFIIISPGIHKEIDIVRAAAKRGIPLVGEIEFASWFTNNPIIGITGSNGKTTTAYLIHGIFRTAGYHTALGGNMGNPFSTIVLEELIHPTPNGVNILEISSFQLEDIHHFSPKIAIVLNISPDHMNRYSDLMDYARTKFKIVQNLDETGALIYNRNDSLIKEFVDHQSDIKALPFVSESESCLFTATSDGIFRNDNLLISSDSIRLKGMHNYENILAAITAAHWFGIKLHFISEAVTCFHNIRHRLELVGELNGIRFYNDSKATNTASTIAAVSSFPENIVLILGGQSKGKPDISELLQIMTNRVKQVYCYGDAGVELLSQVETKFPAEFIWDFTSCMVKIFESLAASDIVLLSPACASFDQFDNFELRGDKFSFLVGDFIREKS
ncbi:MAG: UDP-N-acetylmuramoyl-L-alanine--D-glutamate ligase [Candidatus Marinimicrobia bacterium]|nr:UDP-N-acetylmuramoyl-L-alanine--D-glutamate ligase [Candidatus Neomarinimicrobiota bacterium]